MNDLAIRTEIKHEVYSSAEQVSGPLVQRVSKHVFAVRCQPAVRHPLGYLHICFMEQKTRDGGSEHRFFCSCDTFRGDGTADGGSCLPQWTAMDREREPEWLLRRVILTSKVSLIVTSLFLPQMHSLLLCPLCICQ